MVIQNESDGSRKAVLITAVVLAVLVFLEISG